MSDVIFSKSIRFRFAESDSLQLAPHEITLIVNNRAAFEQRYGRDLPIAGEYTDSRLSNGGETIQLSRATGAVILFEMTYNDREPWPKSPDGQGSSLVLIDPATFSGDASDPLQWQASVPSGGTPGSLIPTTLGTGSRDGDGDGLIDFLERALGSSDHDPTSSPNHFRLRAESHKIDGTAARYWIFETQRDPLIDDVKLTLEMSNNLKTWISASEAFILQASAPDKLVWRSRLPVRTSSGAEVRHLRLRAQQE